MSDTDKVVVYKAKDGWRWHRITSSDITADSGEAYKERNEAIAAATEYSGHQGVDPALPIDIVDE